MVWFKHGVSRGRTGAAVRGFFLMLVLMSGVPLFMVSEQSRAFAEETTKSDTTAPEDNVIPLSNLAGDWKSADGGASMTVKVTGQPGFELLAIVGKDAKSSYQIHCLEIGGVLNCLGHGQSNNGQSNTGKSAAPFLVQSYMRAEESGLSLLETWMVRGAGEDAAGQTKWVKAKDQ